MIEASMNINSTEDVLLARLQKNLHDAAAKNPTLNDFIKNELGVSSIKKEDFLSPAGRPVEGYNFDKSGFQPDKMITSLDEKAIFAHAFKYRALKK